MLRLGQSWSMHAVACMHTHTYIHAYNAATSHACLLAKEDNQAGRAQYGSRCYCDCSKDCHPRPPVQ